MLLLVIVCVVRCVLMLLRGRWCLLVVICWCLLFIACCSCCYVFVVCCRLLFGVGVCCLLHVVWCVVCVVGLRLLRVACFFFLLFLLLLVGVCCLVLFVSGNMSFGVRFVFLLFVV